MAALFASAAAGAAQAQQAGALPTVTVAKPVVRDIVEDDEFVGRFEAVDQVAIRSRVGGYLDEVHFQDGAMVKQGRPALHHRPAALSRRPTMQPSRRSTSPTALLEFAKMQLERAEELAKTGNIPTSTVDDRRREYLAAQAQMQGAHGRADDAPA